jgi:hypothetical protein
MATLMGLEPTTSAVTGSRKWAGKLIAMTIKDERFSSHDPQWCAFFAKAIRRTIEDRRTSPDDAQTLTIALKMLPDALVRFGRKQGRSIVFEFEANAAANQVRSMLLLAGPNFKRRMCVLDVAPDGMPLSVELAP